MFIKSVCNLQNSDLDLDLRAVATEEMNLALNKNY